MPCRFSNTIVTIENMGVKARNNVKTTKLKIVVNKNLICTSIQIVVQLYSVLWY